jgi:N6-adenosine-specific RNA methylase IME4
VTWVFGHLKRMHYGVILADPPWSYETFSEKGKLKSADHHYSVMHFYEIQNLPVHMLGADNSVLVMWATQAMLVEALEVMEAWGYTYKTAGAWAKQSPQGRSWAFGTGYIFRSAAEFYIVGTIGQPRSAVRNIRNLIVAPTRGHSRKPDVMHENLERMFPGVPKCELFARQSRAGWDTWGKETTKFDQEQAA